MFGYVIANEKDLSQSEKDRYRSFYCGLCHNLGRRYGQITRMGLTYDLTFWTILFTSLYEPKNAEAEKRCIIHPVKNHKTIENVYTDYAADLTIALMYYKLQDDWQDEHRRISRSGAKVLEKKYQEIRQRLPRQCKALDEGMAEFSRIEKAQGSADEAARCFGRIIEELFVYQEDMWEKYLRPFGNYLGRFIYLMDAADDLEKDRKSGNYNPFLQTSLDRTQIEDVLSVTIAKAAEEFEKLPLVEDVHLMRSVIYAGVWGRYYANRAREEKKKGKK